MKTELYSLLRKNRLKRQISLIIIGIVLVSCSRIENSQAVDDNGLPESGEPTEAASPAETSVDWNETASLEAELSAMIHVPEGEFTFGMKEDHLRHWVTAGNVYYDGIEERYRKDLTIPERTINLPAFYIDRFETTNREYREFLDATGYQPSDRTDYLKHWTASGSYPDWAADFPVVWVSREDAEAYCRWRGKRLPTEQEWEKAARGDEGLYYPWGNEHPKRETTNISRKQLEPVGNRPLDISPYGVYDMGGNAAEITSSLMQDGRLITKGGSITSISRNCRTYGRALEEGPGYRSESLGFRCVADPR